MNPQQRARIEAAARFGQALASGKTFLEALLDAFSPPPPPPPPAEEDWERLFQRFRARQSPGPGPTQKGEPAARDPQARARAKIASLVALAKGNTNAHEADTAWKMAEELAKKHGLPIESRPTPKPVPPTAEAPRPVETSAPVPPPVPAPSTPRPTRRKAAPKPSPQKGKRSAPPPKPSPTRTKRRRSP